MSEARSDFRPDLWGFALTPKCRKPLRRLRGGL